MAPALAPPNVGLRRRYPSGRSLAVGLMIRCELPSGVGSPARMLCGTFHGRCDLATEGRGTSRKLRDGMLPSVRIKRVRRRLAANNRRWQIPPLRCARPALTRRLAGTSTNTSPTRGNSRQWNRSHNDEQSSGASRNASNVCQRASFQRMCRSSCRGYFQPRPALGTGCVTAP